MKRTNLKAAVAVVGVMSAAAAGLAWAQTAETTSTPPAADQQMPMPGMGGMMGGMMDGGPMGMGRMPMFDFAQLDANKDGKITAEELNQQRADRAKSLDADGNGTISLEEYTAFFRAQREAIQTARDTARFKALDADGNGQLSVAELIVRPMPMRMIERMDANNDGAVTQEEFDAAKARFADRMKGGDFQGREGWHGHHGGKGMMGHGMGWYGGNDDDEGGN